MALSGKIQAVTGLVTARTSEGEVRELRVGDFVYENDTIITADGASLSIIQEDGNLINLAGNEQLLLDESVLAAIDPSDAVSDEQSALQDAIVQALAEGKSIDDVLEKTAAGTEGSGGSYDFIDSDYYAGDASKGDVGTYLLGTENDGQVPDVSDQFYDDVGDVDDETATAAPKVEITEDINDDGTISNTEIDGTVGVLVNTPVGTVIGDVLNITNSDGIITDYPITQDILDNGLSLEYDRPADGTAITVSATLTDQADNISGSGSGTATMGDTTATVAPTVVISEDRDTDGTISNTEIDGKVDVTVTAPAGALVDDILNVTNPDGTVTAYTVNQDIIDNGLKLEYDRPADGDGITVSATLTDQAGNISVPGSGTATMGDTTATVAPTVVISEDRDTDGTISNTEIDGKVDVTVTAPAGALIDDVLNVTNPDGTVTAHTVNQDILDNGLKLEYDRPADGDGITVSATLTDQAGNTSGSGSGTATMGDTTATVAPTVVISEDRDTDGTISNTEIDGKVDVTVTAPAGALVDDVLNVTNPDGTVTAHPVTQDIIDSGLKLEYDRPADGDGITVSATLTDQAGNISVSGSGTATMGDTTAPTVSIDNPIEVDNVADDTEDDDVSISGTTIGVEDGQNVTVSLVDNSDSANPVTVVLGTAAVTGNTWTLADHNLSIYADHSDYTITADVSDAAGNAATQAVQTLELSDTTVPTVSIAAPIEGDNIADDTEDDDVSISGTTIGVEDGQNVTVSLVDNSDSANPVTVVLGTAAVTGNTWTLADHNLSIYADHSDYTITADVSDAAGNAATQAVQALELSDTTVPTVSINTPIEGDNIADDTEDDDVSISGTTIGVEDGQNVTVSLVDNSDSANPVTVVLGTAAVTGNTWTLADHNLSIYADHSDYTITADVSDAAGNAATQAVQTLELSDTTVPTVSIAAPIEGDNIADDTEDDDVSISGTTIGVEDGQNVTVSLVDNSDSANPVTVVLGTAAVTGNTWTLADHNLSIYADHSDYTITADVSDAAGNAATQAVQALELSDTTVPTVSINTPIEGDNIADDTEDDDVSISGTTIGVEDGQNVTVSLVDNSDSANPVTVVLGTAAVTGNTWTLADHNLSIYADHSDYTITADVSDAAGNAATQAVQALELSDTTVPTVSINTPIEGDNIADDTEDDDVSISGTTIGVEDGQNVTVSLVDNSDSANPVTVVLGTAAVTGNTWTLADHNLSIYADHSDYTITADVSDAAGNAATQAVQTLELSDTTVPTVSITAPIEGDNIADDTEDDDVSISGTTIGVEDGQNVTVSLVDNSDSANPVTVVLGTAAVTGNTWTLADHNLSIYADHSDYTITADVSDAAGNAATQAVQTLELSDTTVPTVSITAPIEGDNIADDTEDDDVSISGTTIGVEDGQNVTVSLVDNSDSANPVTVVLGTAAVTGNTWTLADHNLSIYADHSDYTITADVSDAAGNVATQAVQALELSDTTVPTVSITAPIEGDNIADDTEDDDVSISGTTIGVEDGQNVTVSLVDNSDSANPVTVVLGTAAVTGNTWTLADHNLSIYADHSDYTITADVSDAAGNAATQAVQALELSDTTVPTVSINTPIEGDNIADDTEDDDVSISGTTIGVEDGQNVTVSLVDNSDSANPVTVVLGTAAVTGNTWTLADHNLSIYADHSDYTITADVSDAAGNAATQAVQALELSDTTVPTVSINTPIEGDNIADDTEDDDVSISGTTIGVEDGQNVTVSLVDNSDSANPVTVVLGTAAVTGNTWTLADHNLSIYADHSDYTITADVSDAAGNAATQAVQALELSDTTVPTVSINTPIEGDNIADDTEDDDVSISGTTIGVEDGQNVTVSLVDNSDSANPVTVVLGTAAVTGNTWTLADHNLSIYADHSDYTITADVSDAAGNAATQAVQALELSDTTVPTVSINTPIEGDNIADDTEDDDVSISGTTIGVEDGQNVTVSLVDNSDSANPVTVVLGTAAVTGNTWTLADHNLSIYADHSDYTITADVSDAAGNVATQAVQALELSDTTVPTVSINTPIEGDNIADDTEDDDVSISGTTTDVENGQFVTVNLVDSSDPLNPTTVFLGTAEVTDNIWILTDQDLNGYDDHGSYTVTADVSDAAGNDATPASEPLELSDTTAPIATITLTPNITADDVINATEANETIAITGRVTGEFTAGDIVTLTINGVESTGGVLAGGRFSINVAGSDLAADSDTTINASFVATDAAGNTATPVTDTEDYNVAPIAIDDPVHVTGGLHSEYYGVDHHIANITDAQRVISGNDADATFISTDINYGYTDRNGDGNYDPHEWVMRGNLTDGIILNENKDAIDDSHLKEFIKGGSKDLVYNEESIKDGSLEDATNGILHMEGMLNITNGGDYTFNVAHDDGFDLRIDGVSVFRYDAITSTKIEEPVTLSLKEGLHDVEIIYWDQGGAYVFDLDLLDSNGKNVWTKDNLSHAETGSIDVRNDSTITLNLTDNDSDIDGEIDVSKIVITDPPDHGTVTRHDDGTVTYEPNEGYHGLDTFTYTVDDTEGATSNVATVTLNVTPSVGSNAIVYEAGLAEATEQSAGTDPSAAIITEGNLLGEDGGRIVSVADKDGSRRENTITVETDHGTITVYTKAADGHSAGDYIYTLTKSSDGDSVVDSISYEVQHGKPHTVESHLDISIIDDAPVGTNISNNIEDSSAASQTINLIIVLDKSGSMDYSLEGTDSTRIEVAKEALSSMFDSYDNLGNVNIQFVPFDSNAEKSEWYIDDKHGANTYLDNIIPDNGGTCYDNALDKTAEGYWAPPAAKTLVYFISDGEPHQYHGALHAKVDWEEFVTDNDIDISFGIGITNSVSLEALAPIAFADGDGDLEPYLTKVLNAFDLKQTLLDTVGEGVAHGDASVLMASGDGGIVLGADGGHIQSILVDGTLHKYVPVTKVTESINTDRGGTIDINYETGEYIYLINPQNTVLGEEEKFVITGVDKDGDSKSVDLVIHLDYVANLDANYDSIITNADEGTSLDIDYDVLLANDSGTGNTSVTSVAAGSGTDLLTTSAGVTLANVADGESFTYEISSGNASDRAKVDVTRTNASKLTGTSGDDVIINTAESVDYTVEAIVRPGNTYYTDNQIGLIFTGKAAISITAVTFDLRAGGNENAIFDLSDHHLKIGEDTAGIDSYNVGFTTENGGSRLTFTFHPDEFTNQDQFWFRADTDHLGENNGEDFGTSGVSITVAFSDGTQTSGIYNTEAGGSSRVILDGQAALSGEEGNDYLLGSDSSEYLDGGEGRDTIDAGEGDDTIVFDAADTRIDGGGGFDTLLISDAVLDFSHLAEGTVQNIERLDLTDPAAQNINLTLDNVLDMTSLTTTTEGEIIHVLELKGGANDTVTVDVENSTGTWVHDGGLFSNGSDSIQVTLSTDSDNALDNIHIIFDDGTSN
ncbi:Ig-like domain-containing protein [Desulfotalea psychrophila]|uniref:VWFA domain-containing protein n=1 Tax=Desulfotalea psychrophila (strain LSv54 / DSM 12343) TaxID=177439 RepID=Q6AQX9_DESPS|nr:Ig-like domain-containing protein [Desulfotalea psychrophila]CAG35245.1 conserved hypothetical protein [Desulfotalea psychrophila LSv54]